MEEDATSTSNGEGDRELKKLIIDEEDESGGEELTQAQAAEIENGNNIETTNAFQNSKTFGDCENCQGFAANAQRAWTILSDYQQANEKVKQLEKECEQLKRICEEHRNYSDTLRSNEDMLNETIKRKDQEIQMLQEELANVKDQYSRVLKVGLENKKSLEEFGAMKGREETKVVLLNETIKRKNQEIQMLHEEVANVKDQYSRVQKVGLENKKSLEEFGAMKGRRSEETNIVPSQKKSEKEITAKKVFKSRFFIEHKQMPLLEDDVDLDMVVKENTPNPQIQIEVVEENSPKSQIQIEVVEENTPKPQIQIDVVEENTPKPQIQIDVVEENTPKPQIQIDQSTPMGLQIVNIRKKYNVDKDQATLLYCKALREEKKKAFSGGKRRIDSSEEEDDQMSVMSVGSGGKKKENPKYSMPWFPRNYVLSPNIRPSILSFDDHKRYVAIILNQLKPNFKYRHDENKIELKSIDKKLEDERKSYAKMSLQKAKTFNAFDCPNWIKELFKDICRTKLQYYIGERAFQGTIFTVPWSTNLTTTSKSFNLRIATVLAQGAEKFASIPDIKNKCQLDTKSMTKKMKTRLFEKQPILDDQQIQEHGLTNNIPFLMDASTLRHLLCAPWSHRLEEYACRLTVLKRVHSGSMKRLHIISPPIIASRLSITTLAQAFVKWTLKCNLIKEKQEKGPQSSQKAAKKKPRLDEEETGGADGGVDSLLEEMGLGSISAANKNTDQSAQGKRYAIVDLDDPKEEEADQKHKLIIRNGYRLLEESTSMKITATAHAEFLPEVGAEKLTDEEFIWNFITGVLKGSEEHVNFRIIVPRLASAKTDVVQYDRRHSADIQRFSMEIRQLLSSRIQRFCALMDSLDDLDVGEYLLMPDKESETLQIIKEKQRNDLGYEDDEYGDNDGETLYDSEWFHDLIQKKTVSNLNDVDAYWNGVDPHYPLQWQVVKSQIPGALYPKRQ